MLVAVVLVPGPPALVPELMGAAAHELSQLRWACDAALGSLTADLLALPQTPPVQLVVLGSGPAAQVDATSALTFAEFGRDVGLNPLPGGSSTRVSDLATPLMVARYLAARVIGSDPAAAALWAGAQWVTGRAEGAARIGRQIRESDSPTGLVLVADGATCHGPKAPRAEDSRAGASDDAVWAALASGDPARIDALDGGLSAQLGATGPDLWPALVAAASSSDAEIWDATLDWQGAPYGVGWAVAHWLRQA